MPRSTVTVLKCSSCVVFAMLVAAQGIAVGSPNKNGPRATQIPTTLEDFFLPGTQPDPGNPTIDPFEGAIDGNCVNCHADFDEQYLDAEPFSHWNGSMMAQAMRDPVFLAALTISNQDAAFSGDLCLRCHTPSGWIGGRSSPTDGSALSEPADFEGVTCHVCHRMVDPVYVPGISPSEDETILDDLFFAGLLPDELGSGRIVYDPETKVRRGPRDNVNHPQGATAIFSPFHSTSFFCGQCHDVSNPAFSRQPDGTYAPNDLDARHPTMNKLDMFPVERTYSEWTQSLFATTGVDLGDRFGSNFTGLISSCQDCHMPDQTGPGCRNSGTVRDDAPQHAMNGSNNWVLDAVRSLFPDSETGLNETIVQSANARVANLLLQASDMELRQEDNNLIVKITNYSGHKLPTGYPEGRRMWINVQFFDIADQLILEHGAYDPVTAHLNTADTKVYEAKLGIDDTIAGLTGIPAGESFHFAINNVWLKDNRIPPIGFTNASFEAVQALPVDYMYADGQHWDETVYDIPAQTDHADVSVYFQATSAEYVAFLESENTTDSLGTTLAQVWNDFGKSTPSLMDNSSLALTPVIVCPGDINGDNVVDTADLGILIGAFGSSNPIADLNNDGVVDTADLGILIGHFGTSCN